MRLAQLDRAFGYGPKGRGFESSSARYSEKGGYAVGSCIFALFCSVWTNTVDDGDYDIGVENCG